VRVAPEVVLTRPHHLDGPAEVLRKVCGIDHSPWLLTASESSANELRVNRDLLRCDTYRRADGDLFHHRPLRAHPGFRALAIGSDAHDGVLRLDRGVVHELRACLEHHGVSGCQGRERLLGSPVLVRSHAGMPRRIARHAQVFLERAVAVVIRDTFAGAPAHDQTLAGRACDVDVAGGNCDPVGQANDIEDAARVAGGGVIDLNGDRSDSRSGGDQGVHHAGNAEVDPVARRAVDLLGNIDARCVYAEQPEIAHRFHV
jgi:hypothetical protein